MEARASSTSGFAHARSSASTRHQAGDGEAHGILDGVEAAACNLGFQPLDLVRRECRG